MGGEDARVGQGEGIAGRLAGGAGCTACDSAGSVRSAHPPLVERSGHLSQKITDF